MFASIWTNRDTSEAGPSVDDQSATITVEDRQDTAASPRDILLHLVTDGPAGLWTAAVSMPPQEAQQLALDLLREAFSDRGDGRLTHLSERQLDALEALGALFFEEVTP